MIIFLLKISKVIYDEAEVLDHQETKKKLERTSAEHERSILMH